MPKITDMKAIQQCLATCDSALTESLPKLSRLLECGNLSFENLSSLVEGIQEDMKRKEILKQHEPAIKQLPSGRYYTRINGKKVEKTNLKDVEDAIVSFYTGTNATIESIFDSYMERRKMDVSPTTWSKDIRYFNLFITKTGLGKKKLIDLDLDDGYQFLKDCLVIKPDMKRKYWHNLYGFLNQVFQYAIDKRYIDENPFKNMKPRKDLFEAPTFTRDGDTIFTKYEQTRVCELTESDSNETHSSIPLGIVLLFNLGLRNGELCALKWGDIETNIRKTYIHIQREMVADIDEDGKANGFTVLPHCKTPAGDRRLQLNEKAIELFKRIRELSEAEGLPVGLDDFVFLRKTPSGISFCTPRSFDPRLRRYCKSAGMDVIKSPHDVRRTVLTNLYTVGMPLKKIQEYAGHSSLKQTMDYIRISDDDIDMSQYLNTLSEPAEETIIPFRKEA